jgi:RHS repeat-associated protein
VALLNANQRVVARYHYDPFGNLLGMSGPLADFNRYRFSSKEWHPQSGLYHYGYRDYEPNLQRWLNEDPLGEAGGINLYGFVGNNPVNAVDPYGLELRLDSARGLLEVPGPLGYARGDTVLENLGAGAYNVIPLVGNGVNEVANTLLTGFGQVVEGAAGFAGWLTTQAGGSAAERDLAERAVRAASTVLGPKGKPCPGARSGTTPLWRAVNPAELSDLSANAGAFRNPFGIESKYFSETAEGAASYARQTYQAGGNLYQGPYTIIRTDIPSDLITPIMRQSVDRGVPSVVVPTELLPRLTPGQPLPFTPLPGRP